MGTGAEALRHSLPAMTTTAKEIHFVIDGIHRRHNFRDCLGYLAASKEAAIARCQQLNPDFEILRVRLADA
jgi:hypothetical protein